MSRPAPGLAAPHRACAFVLPSQATSRNGLIGHLAAQWLNDGVALSYELIQDLLTLVLSLLIIRIRIVAFPLLILVTDVVPTFGTRLT